MVAAAVLFDHSLTPGALLYLLGSNQFEEGSIVAFNARTKVPRILAARAGNSATLLTDSLTVVDAVWGDEGTAVRPPAVSPIFCTEFHFPFFEFFDQHSG